MEFKLICSETNESGEKEQSAVQVICFSDEDIENAKTTFGIFMDGKKKDSSAVYTGIIKPARAQYAVCNDNVIIIVDQYSKNWEYTVHERAAGFAYISSGDIIRDGRPFSSVIGSICASLGIDISGITQLPEGEYEAYCWGEN